MASSAPNLYVVSRAAAILTASEVDATAFDLNAAYDYETTVLIDFTLGSLTNCVVRFYVSNDGETYWSLMSPTGASLTQTLTASAAHAYPVQAPGMKYLKVSIQGTGTVTSSTATITTRYARRQSQ